MNEIVNEQWKAIEDFPHYEISDCGNIRNSKTCKMRKQITTRLGYKQIVLVKEHKAYALSIHRLVAFAFLPAVNSDRNEINHIDGVKANNHVSNLEWSNRKENMRHAWASGLMRYVAHHTSFNLETRVATTDKPYKGNKSSFKGVTRHGSKWRATIHTKGKQTHLGVFETPELAHTAYCDAITRLGE